MAAPAAVPAPTRTVAVPAMARTRREMCITPFSFQTGTRAPAQLPHPGCAARAYAPSERGGSGQNTSVVIRLVASAKSVSAAREVAGLPARLRHPAGFCHWVAAPVLPGPRDDSAPLHPRPG